VTRIPLLASFAALALLPATASAAVPVHGRLISKERVSGGSLPAGGTSYRVLYSSRWPDGTDRETSGVITVPKGRAPKGGFPVISWAHGTTGIADACAPSRFVTQPPASDYVKHFRTQTSGWVKRGYAVAQTDYQGLGTPGLHPYLIGVSEGRSVVDIVSAARDLSPKVGRRWVAIGHSQGGHAALWAAAIAKRYAPALRLRAAVPLAPGTHVGELSALIATTDGNPFGGLPAMIIAAAADQAGVAPETVFSDRALALYPQIEKVCLGQLSQPDSFGGLGLKEHLREGYDRAPLVARVAANDPEDLTIKVPLLIAQGKEDRTAFPQLTDQTVDALRSRGTKVTYRTYDGVDHSGVVWAARTAADAYIAKRLGSSARR
jgi:pimeloyl-ACP methyl ester carboxylesterase